MVLQGVEPWSENINTTKSIYCRNCFALWNYDEPQTFICLTSPVYISLISMKLTRLRNGHICSVLTIHVWYGDLCLSCWLGVRWGEVRWGEVRSEARDEIYGRSPQLRWFDFPCFTLLISFLLMEHCPSLAGPGVHARHWGVSLRRTRPTGVHINQNCVI